MKVALIGEERTVHKRVSVTIPRNPEWRWGDGAMANTIALRHYALDGAIHGTMVFSTMKGMSAKDAAEFALANFQGELRGCE